MAQIFTLLCGEKTGFGVFPPVFSDAASGNEKMDMGMSPREIISGRMNWTLFVHFCCKESIAGAPRRKFFLAICCNIS
jgi:hypothetical protein